MAQKHLLFDIDREDIVRDDNGQTIIFDSEEKATEYAEELGITCSILDVVVK